MAPIIDDGGDSTTTVESFEGNIVSDWSPAYEDQDERVSAVESSLSNEPTTRSWGKPLLI